MSFMQDIIRNPKDLGSAIEAARKASHLTAVELAERSGRARSLLYRLERGEDVTVASLLDLLRAMGLTIRLEPLGLPNLAEVRRRFGDEGERDG
jgi:HTH-type transcriptional regulator / antitoxin HipB